MEREIGSEFHRMPLEDGQGLFYPRKGSLVFSGRTAIEAVLYRLPKAKSALLPSYCCESVIEPFRRAGIEIRFFDVTYQDGINIRLCDTADILLWCNYFGYCIEMPIFTGIIIEDITHSLLSEQQCHANSNYLVASIRKWEPINCGGYCSVNVDYNNPPENFVSKKQKAMQLKEKYLSGEDEKIKETFLTMFKDSNSWILENYSNLAIDSWSQYFLSHVNVETQRKRRRDNAHVLYDGLKGKVNFLFSKEDMDCPLFVPVLFPERRDEIRQKLIENKIYCPVHWKKPKDCESNIYDMELSLICDQRYTENDMERVVSTIQKFL